MNPQDCYDPPGSFEQLIELVRSICGIDDLFAMGHDLRSITQLSGTFERLDDTALIDQLLAGKTATHDGHHFVPLMVHQFPFLIGRLTQSANPVSSSWAALVAAHERTVFEQLERLRRPAAMSIAAQLQWDQLPQRTLRTDRYDVAATLEPAATVAGDMYDVAITPEGTLTILGMDAMGHGVSATLSAALALAAIRNARRAGAPLNVQVEAADQAMISQYDGHRFVTMVGVELRGDHVAVVNAGHEPVRRGVPGRVETLDIPADPPLGLEGHSDYREHRLDPLQPGESLCLLSDGAPESRNAERVVLGERGVNDIIGRRLSDSSLQSAHRIGRAVLEYTGTLVDDLTVVVATRRP